MPQFSGTVTLAGSRRMKTTLRIQFADPGGATALDSYGLVRQAFIDFITDLKQVTDAAILNAYITDNDATDYLVDGLYQGVDEVDVKDYATLVVYINNDPKFGTLNIPAPKPAIFEAGSAGREVDITDTAVQNFVENWVENLMLSDGEHVDDALGQAGLYRGYWRQVAASARS
jgi:hypothetical protein